MPSATSEQSTIDQATTPMNWAHLLNETRQRQLFGGDESKSSGGDVRTAFGRDYDRSLFSTPVRRLQDKAQVFPLEPNDSVRTRLTHSLEVSTIARELAGDVGRRLLASGGSAHGLEDVEQVAAVQVVAATCGLLHDLGNPPFGHSGEAAIRSWFVRDPDRLPPRGQSFRNLDPQYQSDFLNFEGNAQTLRLVSKLQVLTDWHGLNLTAATLSALCKYTAPSHEADRQADDHARSKPGYFASESDLIRLVRDATGTGDARHPITCIVEAADDIVYSMIDLEDGVKKGVIDWPTLRKELTADDSTDLARECVQSAERRVEQSPMPLSGRALDEASVQALRTIVISRTVEAAAETFVKHYDDIMHRRYRRELVQDGAAAPLIKACKAIGRRHVYRSPDVVRVEIMGQRVLHDLMDLFWQAARAFELDWLDDTGRIRSASHEAKIYSMISQNYRTVFEHELKRGELPELYCRLQLVTDHIAGMTDTYACTVHRQLTNT